MIVDAQGNQRYSSLKTPPPMHNVSDRTYFIAQQDGTATGMFMSEPLVTRTGLSAAHSTTALASRNGFSHSR
jgi:hypothetical protein